MKSHLLQAALSRACAVSSFCATLSSSMPAVALDEAYVDHAKRARIGYDLQDWATAVREYRAAYEAEQKPEHLFGLAQALRLSGDYTAAIYSFKAFRRLDGISQQQAAAADLLIAKCEAELAKTDAEEQRRAGPAAAAETEGRTDHDPVAPLQMPSRAEVAVQPRAGGPGEPAPAEPPSLPSRAFYQDILGDSLFIAGLAAAGVGTGTLLGGNAAMKDAAAEPTEADAREAIDSARQKQVIGSVLLPIGGALIAGAVWRWVSGDGASPEVGGVSVGPSYLGYWGEF